MSIDIPLILFAKAPIPGKVKTRLQTHCTAKQAAKIAEFLMEGSIQTVSTHWPGSVYLSVWLDHQHDFFQMMQARYALPMVQQADGDLGEKMRHALESLGYPAVVMGCDAPHTMAETLRDAYRYLLQGESVIGPSDDGGYYLLGLTQPVDGLFDDQRWGSDTVFTQTLQAANEASVTLTQLASLNDVDEWSDLLNVVTRYGAQFAQLNQYLQSEGLF